MQNYQALEAHFRTLGHLQHVGAIAGWDEAAMMPPGGGPSRGESLATLDVVMHEMLTDPSLPGRLDAAEAEPLDEWQAANVREMRRQVTDASALPADFVRRMTEASIRCEQLWRVKRAENDWSGIRDDLSEVIQLSREKGERLGQVKAMSPYDALLDQYEAGLATEQVGSWFAHLRDVLPVLVQEIRARQEDAGRGTEIGGTFPDAAQHRLGTTMMRTLGFDFERGRLDVSHHPFCGGVPDDTRITTRYNPENFLESLMAVLHETGHAMYEQGLPADWRHQPVGVALGMAVHESQSLLMEMQACRSREFFEYAAPHIRDAFVEGGNASGTYWSADNLYRLATRVEPGFIRVDADEATYPLHVILRFEIEQQLFNGDLAVDDLPAAWNEKMRAYLDIDPGSNDADGVMQDVHWYAGLCGYFPTYTVGAMMAAQLFAAAERAIPDVRARIGEGDFSPLLGWLREHVHGKGSLLDRDALMTAATGEPLDPRHFEAHLRRRYLQTA